MAGISARMRYGAGDEYFTATGASKEHIAAKYNVPVERVIEPTTICTNALECLTQQYTIEPPLPKIKIGVKNANQY